MVKRLLILLILIIIIVPFTLAYDLSDFPDFLINNDRIIATIVVGEKPRVDDLYAAGSISSSLRYAKTTNLPQECTSPDALYREYCPRGLELKAITIDKDISYEDSYILIGGPCANKITAQIMDLPMTWPECANGFKEGIGKIILYNKWNKTQLVIAGYSAKDTFKASKVMFKFKDNNLSGIEIEAIGDSNNLTINKVTESKYNEWLEEENKRTNLNHPYVRWLIDGKGNGTFTLYIKTKPEILIEGKNELLKFGDVDYFRCYESKNVCELYLKITDFKFIKDLFKISYVKDIRIEGVESDYKLNISLNEANQCNKDEDCVLARNGCCASAHCNFEAVNKNYKDLWETKVYCLGMACIARVCSDTGFAKCKNNQCTRVSYKYCNNHMDCISSKSFGCVSKDFCGILGGICKEDGNETCNCINNECPNDLIKMI